MLIARSKLAKMHAMELSMTGPVLTRRLALVTGLSGLTFACSARPDSPVVAANSGGAWRDGPALPYAAQEIYPTLHQGRIHLAGGFIAEADSISGVTDRHIVLDPTSGSWSDLAPLPGPRHHPNLISFGGELFAIGGFEAQSEQAVWVMQPGTWRFDGDDVLLHALPIFHAHGLFVAVNVLLRVGDVIVKFPGYRRPERMNEA